MQFGLRHTTGFLRAPMSATAECLGLARDDLSGMDNAGAQFDLNFFDNYAEQSCGCYFWVRVIAPRLQG
ncbi:MAG: hypothetical protein K6356_15970 [Chloroflexus sp.]